MYVSDGKFSYNEDEAVPKQCGTRSSPWFDPCFSFSSSARTSQLLYLTALDCVWFQSRLCNTCWRRSLPRQSQQTRDPSNKRSPRQLSVRFTQNTCVDASLVVNSHVTESSLRPWPDDATCYRDVNHGGPYLLKRVIPRS